MGQTFGFQYYHKRKPGPKFLTGQTTMDARTATAKNKKFAKALRSAIERGEEHCTAGVSTAAGTKFPVYYLPGDWG
jgi:hypothetical protein